jgi:uncharacterized protein YukE
MMFRVEPDHLRVYAEDLAALSDHTETARSYANRMGTFTVLESGAIGMIFGSHQRFADDLNTKLQKLAMLLDASSSNMQAWASQYQRTDAGSAAEIDAALPASSRPIPGVS